MFLNQDLGTVFLDIQTANRKDKVNYISYELAYKILSELVVFLINSFKFVDKVNKRRDPRN
jgi:hypothetical protein